MSFAMILVVFFVPPLYFILRRRWVAFMLNGILYFMAFITVFIFGIGVFFWALAFGHAVWNLRRELMAEHAEILATKMAETMRSEKEE